MTNPNRVEKAEEEAVAWHARFGATSIDSGAIEEFFEWRSKPGNADAYRRVDRVWRESQDLGSDPAIAEALDGARHRGRRSGLGRRSVLIGGLAGATALLLIAGAWLWSGRGAFATDVGEQRVIRLADGSKVNLDTDSRIRVRFTNGERRIDLDHGRALFDVAPAPERPFVVYAGDARVTAVGTVFDVRRAGEAVSVTLVSGVIDVVAPEMATGERRMAAGQQTRVSGSAISTRAVDVAAETSWTSGRLIFSDIPLEQAVSEMNRYLTDKIELDDPGIRTVAINGVFLVGDRDAFVSAASDGLGLKSVPKADGSVGLVRRGN